MTLNECSLVPRLFLVEERAWVRGYAERGNEPGDEARMSVVHAHDDLLGDYNDFFYW